MMGHGWVWGISGQPALQSCVKIEPTYGCTAGVAVRLGHASSLGLWCLAAPGHNGTGCAGYWGAVKPTSRPLAAEVLHHAAGHVGVGDVDGRAVGAPDRGAQRLHHLHLRSGGRERGRSIAQPAAPNSSTRHLQCTRAGAALSATQKRVSSLPAGAQREGHAGCTRRETHQEQAQREREQAPHHARGHQDAAAVPQLHGVAGQEGAAGVEGDGCHHVLSHALGGQAHRQAHAAHAGHQGAHVDACGAGRRQGRGDGRGWGRCACGLELPALQSGSGLFPSCRGSWHPAPLHSTLPASAALRLSAHRRRTARW